ncbi:MAG: 50S ribosomal protein L30 [bacterium]|jgi:large subunit ribosomal protein L30
MAKQLEITLIRSTIGRVPKHRQTVKALGLKKLHKPVVVDDSPQIRGMINSINYMLKVRDINE